MQTPFSDPYLIGDLAILVFLIILVYTCVTDELWKTVPPCRYFMIWLVGGLLSICFDITEVFLSFSGVWADESAERFFLFVYYFLEVWESLGMSLWALELIREKSDFSRKAEITCAVLLPALGISIDIAIFLAGDALPWLIYLPGARNLAVGLGLSLFTLARRQKLGRETVLLLLSTILLPLTTYLIQGDIQVMYTKFTVLTMILVVYLSMWKVRKEEFSRQHLELAEKDAELASKKAELAQKEMELTENRVALMMSQIQPHFLYNTLSSIARLCDENPRQAQQVAMDFSAYFRENLESLNSDVPILFTQELEHTMTYLNIELARFPETLHVKTDIGVEDFYIPALTLQPLVENAVKHGITRKEGGGTVTIEAFEMDDAFEVTVSDDGVGFDLSEKNTEHIGITSVRQRLMSQCAGALIFKSTPGAGTTVTIYLPKEGINS